MVESFGARLRRRREEQAIALATIAEQTKIKASLLESLERDDVSHWPSGIFRRAFIRAYASAIGLNPDAVVREFLEVHPEPAEVVAMAMATAAAADAARSRTAPPSRIREMVDSAIGSLAWRRNRAAAEAPPAGADERTSETVADQPVAPDERTSEVFGDSSAAGDGTNEVAADPAPVSSAASPDPDVVALARLCTQLGRVEHTGEVQPLLREAADVLDAMGLIVWVWDGVAGELRPALAHGYSDKVLAQLPTVRRDADNATAAAFRSGHTCTISGNGHSRGALAVPMLTPAGCAGVLAIELHPGREQTASVRAVATILAAMLGQLMDGRAADLQTTRCTSTA